MLLRPTTQNGPNNLLTVRRAPNAEA